MGDQADDIFKSLQLTAAQSASCATVKAQLEGYFVVKRNVIFERVKFNKWVQHEDESVDSLITELDRLAEHCQFDTLHDELIRDRLVIGLRDSRLAEILQLDAELTLEKHMTQARQSI